MKLRYIHRLALATVLILGTVSLAEAARKKETPPSVNKNHRDRKTTVKPGRPGSFAKSYRMDAEMTRRSKGLISGLQTSSVIVMLEEGKTAKDIPNELVRYLKKRNLGIINGQVLDLPNRLLKKLADDSHVVTIHENRSLETTNYRTAVATGARAVNELMGLSGTGVGVAVIDSGISAFHNDLTVANSATLYPYGNQRVAKFVDFVNGQTLPYDDNGHGTHVAGIVGGNGFDSSGMRSRAGTAPKASIVALKVLGANGEGTIADIIEALNWVYVNRTAYNIRVVNLSVGAPVRESYWTDPLTLAAKKLTDQGIVVVVAAGNRGLNAAGQTQYGGITAPGNAPWVLTVGASSTQGTLSRRDDVVANYSSRGPTYGDWGAKPDLVAPGTATESLAVPGSTFYSNKVKALVKGTDTTKAPQYLSLSGTSMAAPVVSGTVALMLQANPNLTPNLVKAILQYTAQKYPGYNALTQGAGFLNTLGAVRLAKFYATAKPGARVPVQSTWSRHVIWGNQVIAGGVMVPSKNAWKNSVVWGSARTLGSDGDNIIWGTQGDGDNIIWGTSTGENIIWGTDSGANIIWGTSDVANIIWGTSFDGDNIIWGTNFDGDNIIWGTDCGGADCDNTVWGTSDGDNIIWGTASDGDNIIWGTSDLVNIIWGTSGNEDITWGLSGPDTEPTFAPEDPTELPPSLELEFGDVVPLADAVIAVGGI
jgi:subtilisin family serine protease